MATATQCNVSAANLVSFDKWLADRGSTRVTGYRYRQRGLINAVNIFGRLYVSREEIHQFEERALRGDFARAVKIPDRAARGASSRKRRK